MSRVLKFRISDDKADMIEEAAKMAGVTLSDFVRDAALERAEGGLCSPGVDTVDIVVDGGNIGEELPKAVAVAERKQAVQKGGIPQRWQCGCTANPPTRMFNHAAECTRCHAPYPGKKVKE